MGFEPMIRVLQDPTLAIQTLARLLSDSAQGSADSWLPVGPRPLTVFWGQATDTIEYPRPGWMIPRLVKPPNCLTNNLTLRRYVASLRL
jgi:hypothetical protein